jgi:hypothetical protein
MLELRALSRFALARDDASDLARLAVRVEAAFATAMEVFECCGEELGTGAAAFFADAVRNTVDRVPLLLCQRERPCQGFAEFRLNARSVQDCFKRWHVEHQKISPSANRTKARAKMASKASMITRPP